MTGAKAAGSVINAVILTSVLSAGNHALFAGTRLMYTLAMEGHAPKVFGKLNRHQVPWVAVLATGFVSGLCFGSSFIGAGQLWNWLQKYVMLQSLFHLLQSLTSPLIASSVFPTSSAGSPSVSLRFVSGPPLPAKARRICCHSRTGLIRSARGLRSCSTRFSCSSRDGAASAPSSTASALSVSTLNCPSCWSCTSAGNSSSGPSLCTWTRWISRRMCTRLKSRWRRRRRDGRQRPKAFLAGCFEHSVVIGLPLLFLPFHPCYLSQ